MEDDNIINNDIDLTNGESDSEGLESKHALISISGMYENYFLDYASYVILERAVPGINDGLKPVQRRILHAMKVMDDGRFNKVANVIGSTMQYHPHGDAAIGEAMVNIGQKDLLIECQGNWGDIRTGDSAAAPRYIEARLSKFALEVVFNSQTTEWQLSYDGRKSEPVSLPVKFPLVLAMGVEGIAVGLATKIMPHNFIELCEASINFLRKKPFELYPDFQTGGLADFSNYNDGKRGGKIKVRAKIEEFDKKTLLIKEIPFGTTTASLIESIIKANDAGKIKIKKVIDNTAKNVEIEIQLHPGTSPDILIDALYAFTDCEYAISPNACVIIEDKPLFLGISELLKISTDKTLQLLKRELEIRLNELEDKWHFSSLEKIFIENRIYRDIEESETWEDVLSTIDTGLTPFKKLLLRAVTREDIIALTEIKIKRISKFDAFKADELIQSIENEMAEVKNHLENLIDYAVNYFKSLIKKYGKDRERKTQFKQFEVIQAQQVAIANLKLYVNRKDGFIGTGLKKDEYIGDCSEIDDIIVFRKDGKFSVSKVSDKTFVGKDIIHAAVWKKNDELTTYNLLYLDGKTGITRGKRFNVTAITRDKEYDLTTGTTGTKITYFTANNNGEAEVINILLSPIAKARIKTFDFNFAELEIKGRSSQGNIITKHPVKLIKLKEKGKSTLGGRKIWYDANIGKLNTDERGQYLGRFDTNDLIIVLNTNGEYELTAPELTNRYESDKVLVIDKFNPDKIISAVYYDGASKVNYAKMFKVETSTLDKPFNFISDSKGSKILMATLDQNPTIVIKGGKKGSETESIYDFSEIAELRGWKANGTKLSDNNINSVEVLKLEPEIEEESTTNTLFN